MTSRKDEVLAATDGGLTIFQHLIPSLPQPKGKRTPLFPSLFREESTPSANLYHDRNGVWHYKDHGDSAKPLNAIDLIMQLQGIEFTEALKLAADYANLVPANYVRKPAAPEVVLLVDPKKANRIMTDRDTPFHKFARAHRLPTAHLLDWLVGGMTYKEQPITCFLYRNAAGQYVNNKRVLYNANGKRDKDWKIGSEYSKVDGEVYKWCLYGEHLAEKWGQNPVCIVESEKTAILASWFYPQFGWVASRGQNGANKEEYAAVPQLLDGRALLVLCDADPVRKVPKAFSVLKEMGANVHLLDLMPERTDKTDLADYIVEGVRPDINVPLGQHTVPKWAQAKSLAEVAANPEESVDSEEGSLADLIPAEAFKEPGNKPKHDLYEYGFFQYRNRYWKVVKSGKKEYADAFTNFTIKVLYHIESGRTNRRLVELKNSRYTKYLEVDTKALTALSSFKEFTEGAGNFVFEGNATDHTRLKRKLFDQELTCTQIDVLGHQPKSGYFAFANGMYKAGQWLEVDDRGIIHVGKEAYYIAAANKTYENNATLFSNERKIIHNHRPVDFGTWARMHRTVFGDASMMRLLFGVSCLFSDVVFNANQYFPLLFLYGEGGSGKGELIRSIQHFFGKPQDPLHLSSDANTDKSKIREMAQFKNLVICLEEYRNGNEKTVNLLKGLWDRFGYKRARMDSGYGTETVPINSGVMITGNDYPTDDPLLQRIIMLELHANQRTNEQIEMFRQLKQVQEDGITSITCQLLDHREHIEANFKEAFRESQRAIRELMRNLEVTDRMSNNVAVLDAMFGLLADRLPFPFTRQQFREYARKSMERQNSKRNAGGEVQRFWEIVLALASQERIRDGHEVRIDGNHLFLRFTEIHVLYMEKHRLMYSAPGLAKTTLLDKLRNSPCFVESKDSVRIGESRSSGHVFLLDKIGVDLDYVLSKQNKGLQVPENTASQPVGGFGPNMQERVSPF